MVWPCSGMRQYSIVITSYYFSGIFTNNSDENNVGERSACKVTTCMF